MDKMEGISGKTGLLAVIGSPVGHSLSPCIHNASFAHLGVDAVYLAFDVHPEDLAQVIPAFKKMGVIGFNVTMPLKQAVMGHLDEVSDSARFIGAVNTVLIRNGKTYGDNTDGRGFWRNCREHSFEVRGKNVLVLGAGGAGCSVFVQAALEGAASVTVANRKGLNFDSAEKIASELSAYGGAVVRLVDIEDPAALKSACDASDIVVNCTNIGMAPNTDASVLPVNFLHEGLTVADVVYNPLETKLLRDARSMGLPVVPGLGMLVWQAVLAEEIWFPHCQIDPSVLRSAVSL